MEFSWKQLTAESCKVIHFVSLAFLACINLIQFFLVRIFPNSGWKRRFTEQISVFTVNTRKYGSEKLRNLTMLLESIADPSVGLELTLAVHCVKYGRIRFSLTRIFPYKDKFCDSVLILENMDQKKPVFWNILHSSYSLWSAQEPISNFEP